VGGLRGSPVTRPKGPRAVRKQRRREHPAEEMPPGEGAPSLEDGGVQNGLEPLGRGPTGTVARMGVPTGWACDQRMDTLGVVVGAPGVGQDDGHGIVIRLLRLTLPPQRNPVRRLSAVAPLGTEGGGWGHSLHMPVALTSGAGRDPHVTPPMGRGRAAGWLTGWGSRKDTPGGGPMRKLSIMPPPPTPSPAPSGDGPPPGGRPPEGAPRGPPRGTGHQATPPPSPLPTTHTVGIRKSENQPKNIDVQHAKWEDVAGKMLFAQTTSLLKKIRKIRFKRNRDETSEEIQFKREEGPGQA